MYTRYALRYITVYMRIYENSTTIFVNTCFSPRHQKPQKVIFLKVSLFCCHVFFSPTKKPQKKSTSSRPSPKAKSPKGFVTELEIQTFISRNHKSRSLGSWWWMVDGLAVNGPVWSRSDEGNGGKKETEVSGIQLVDVDVCELQGGGR